MTNDNALSHTHRRLLHSRLFSSDEPIFPGTTTPRFGDPHWDLSAHLPVNVSERYIDLSTFPVGWELTAREVGMILLQPDHPSVVSAGVVRRGTAKAQGVLATLTRLRVFCRWAEANDVPTPDCLEPSHLLRFLFDMDAGSHRSGGTPLSGGTQLNQFKSLVHLYKFREALTDGGIHFDPLLGRTAEEVVGVKKNSENLTAPLPFETWSRAIRNAWFVVDVLGPDIAEADRIRRSLLRRARGPAAAARRAVEEFLSSGGKVPLHTGYGRNPSPRGTLNRALLGRMCGISSACLNPSNKAYDATLEAWIESLATDPGRSVLGGLYIPKAEFDATERHHTWGAEIGLGEAEHLPSVLRGASYLLLAGLTAMRDSELQELASTAIERVDGLLALRSTQHKGEAGEMGESRLWYAPDPVIRVVEVLSLLTPIPSMIFARSEGCGAYHPARDIDRFVEFVNAREDSRVGRGNPLPLDPIDRSSGALNQLTMRRSFAVFAARYPQAEIGLGIQLGHAALRMTSGYFLDSQQRVARLFDDDRRRAAGDLARSLIVGEEPVCGEGSTDIKRLQAMVVEDPVRAKRLVDSLADRYHLGAMNDCHYRSELAKCGEGGPHLSEKRCATSSCHNAVITERHRPAWVGQLNDIDDELDREHLHPVFRELLGLRRIYINHVLVELGPTRRKGDDGKGL